MFNLFRSRVKHTRLAQRTSNNLDHEILLPSSACSSSFSSPASSSSPVTIEPALPDRTSCHVQITPRTLGICTIVYLGAAIWIFLSVQGGASMTNAEDFCMHHVSRYSLIVEEVKPNWHTQLFNGTFLHQNVYRQQASREVDAAWAALGVNYRSIVVPEGEAERSGLRRDQVKVSQEYGGGYPANVEGLHHLHCLDLLRKTLHWNYDYYLAKKEGPFSNSEYIVRVHTTHCLDILRQVLMCTPDVGVLGQMWWQPENETSPMAFVDFNTKHRCRDYEGVRAWAEAHQLPPEEEVDMARFYEMPKPGDTIYSEIP